MQRRSLALVVAATALAVAVTGGALAVLNQRPAGSGAGGAVSGPARSTPTSGPAAPGGTTGSTGSMKVLFSDPWSTAYSSQYRLHLAQIAAIKAAPKGATITIVTYTFATQAYGEALLAAYRRGVNVRMIIDDHENYRWTKRLQTIFGTNQNNGSYIVRCHLACASDITYPRRRSKGTIRPYQHAKWLLIDRSGSDRDVVMIPSENLTPAATQQSNDLLVMKGNKAAYDFLIKRFSIMKKDSGSAYGTLRSGSLTLEMFPAPLPQGYTIDPTTPVPAAMEPFLKYLKNVQCGGEHSTTIRIAMYMWTYPRLLVAQRFAELAKAGCSVEAVGQPLSPEHDEGWDPEITSALLAGGVKLHQTSGKGVYLHSKIVTIEGWDTSDKPLRLAVTGSSNLLLQALVASDDLIVTNTNRSVVDTYSQHIDWLIAHHSTAVTK